MRNFILCTLLCAFFSVDIAAQEPVMLKDFSATNNKSNDFGLSFNLGLEKKIVKRLSLNLEAEARTQDNTSKMERWMVGANLQYKFFQTLDKRFSLKAGVGFNYFWKHNLSETTAFEKLSEHFNSSGVMNGYTEKSGYKVTDAYWRNRWRTSGSVTATYSPNRRWTFSLKETLQYNRYCSTDSIGRMKTTTLHYKWREYGTDLEAGNLTNYPYKWVTREDGSTMYYYDNNHYGVNDEDNLYTRAEPEDAVPYDEVDNKSPRKPKDRWVLRNKITAKYDVRGMPLAPYASIDYGVGLNYTTNKWKYTVGAEYTINKQHEFDFFYRFSHEDDEDEPNGHLIGVGYKYSF